MKKLISFNIHSLVDVITNSSSELFVFQASEKESLKEIISEIYPDYLNEYEELKSVDDLSTSELDMFFDYSCSAHCWPAQKDMYPVLPGFTFEELYEEDPDDRSNHVGVQYRLKNNVKNPESKWDRSFVTDENREEILDKLDPNRKLYFLFSIGENPDWDKQQELENIGVRYHLG